MPTTKTQTPSDDDPVVVANRHAERIAEADRRHVFAVAVSDPGIAALTAAAVAVEQRDTPDSTWTGSRSRAPTSPTAKQLAAVAHLARRMAGTPPSETGWCFTVEGDGAHGQCGCVSQAEQMPSDAARSQRAHDPSPSGEPADICLVRVLRETPAGAGRHALAVVVEAGGVPLAVTPFRPIIRASLPSLHRVTQDAAGALPAVIPAASATPCALPDTEPIVRACASWLLSIFDQTGARHMRGGRGAPWAMRLWIGALLHTPVEERIGKPVSLAFPVPEVVSWLHPHGWANSRRRGEWTTFRTALEQLGTLRIPTPAGWIGLVSTRVIPDRWDDDRDIVFETRIPAQARTGARVDWPTLCTYGVESTLLYRGYLSICAFLDRSAYHGQPMPAFIHPPIHRPAGNRRPRRRGRRLVRDATRLVEHPMTDRNRPLTDHDVVRMFGLTDGGSNRRRARVAVRRFIDDRVVEYEDLGGGRFRLWAPSEAVSTGYATARQPDT